MSRRIDVFVKVWRELASLGQCDAFGGKEYERVFKEFQQAPAVRHFVRTFIIESANRPVQSFPHTDVSQLFDKGGD